MARYSGKGWHRQSIRHSRARKYGKAGGRYANKRILHYGKIEEPETIFFNSHKIKIMKAETNEPAKFKFTIDGYYVGFGETKKEALNNAKEGIKDIDDIHPLTLRDLKEMFQSDFKAGKRIYTIIDNELYSYIEGKQATTMKKEKNLDKVIRGQVIHPATFNLFA